MRRIRWLALWVLVVTIAFYLLGEHSKRRDWREQFLAGKGQLTEVTETLIEEGLRNSLLEFRLANDSEIRVRGNLRVPNGTGKRYPVLLMLGGLRTGKETLAYVGPSEDVILAALDYPYEGKRRRLTKLEALRSLPAMRRAIVNTPPAAMLVVDYLQDREDLDPDRIAPVGGSPGALFAPAVAVDERFAAVALLLGGADLDGLLDANLKAPLYLKMPAQWPLSVIASPVEPAKYIGRISPRPLLMVNATEDPSIPVENARLLHDAAGEPKTVKWIPAGHVTIRDKEFGRLVVRELVGWLTDQGLTPPHAFHLAIEEPPHANQAVENGA